MTTGQDVWIDLDRLLRFGYGDRDGADAVLSYFREQLASGSPAVIEALGLEPWGGIVKRAGDEFGAYFRHVAYWDERDTPLYRLPRLVGENTEEK